MGAGIALLRAWANAGNRTAPSNAKIDQGWLVGEQPACEHENERQYTRDEKINEIAGYLNTGVPLDDLIAGNVQLLSSSTMQFGADAANHLEIRKEALTVYNANKTIKTQSEATGFNIEAGDGSQLRFLTPFSIDVSGLSWSNIGDGYFTTTNNINLGRSYAGDVVLCGCSASLKVASASSITVVDVREISFTESGGDLVLNSLTIRSTTDPGGAVIEKARITGWWGRALSDTN